jgi:hypothetical protein
VLQVPEGTFTPFPVKTQLPLWNFLQKKICATFQLATKNNNDQVLNYFCRAELDTRGKSFGGTCPNKGMNDFRSGKPGVKASHM